MGAERWRVVGTGRGGGKGARAERGAPAAARGGRGCPVRLGEGTWGARPSPALGSRPGLSFLPTVGKPKAVPLARQPDARARGASQERPLPGRAPPRLSDPEAARTVPTRPPNRGRQGWGSRRGNREPRGPYRCRRFFRFLVWFKADLDIFRSLEETSSESEKRTEAHAAECGARWAGLGNTGAPSPPGRHPGLPGSPPGRPTAPWSGGSERISL